MRRALLPLLVLALLAISLLEGVARAGDLEPIDVDRGLVLVTRALSYDRNLRDRAEGTLGVALVALSGAEPSRTHAARRRLIAMEGVSVQGLPLRIVELPTGEALESALVREQVDVAVLVGGAPPEELERVSGVLRGHRVLTLSLEPEHLGHGCGVGVGVERGRARLVVDLTAARSSGADFSGELLQLAKVMR